LPDGELAGLDLTVVGLKAHQATHSIGRSMNFVDFPIDAVLSVVAMFKDGDTVEVGTVGSESFVESEAALETSLSTRTAFCQVEGSVARMSIEDFDQRMETSSAFARSMRHNVRAVLFTAQQFTACNVKHTDLQRCARWLAMTQDRVGRVRFTLSREFLAIMLGVPSAAVTVAVDEIRASGAIVYDGPALTIVDRTLLAAISCECYAASKGAFAASLSR
jgi:CRP-like cAMP-binding protein